MSATGPGRFVWYELMTTDPAAAIAFYRDIVGWNVEPFGDDYAMWMGDQGPVGGVTTLPERARAMGAPPHWLSNVTVDDLDASVAKARELGATVYVEPQEVPDVGRFAVIADPQGAAIALFTPAREMPDHDQSGMGEFCWSELMTTDQDGALAFYSALFGWDKVDEFDMGPMGVYLLFGRGTKQLGGMMNHPADHQGPPAWLYYTHVPDLDASIARAQARGAQLLNGPMEVPGGARVAQLMDAQGAAFALLGDALG
jgi:predicted enzyme related to lactoylglutathione lyase